MARPRLVDRLLASNAPVISVVAPPGYGKTTVLAQWAERKGPAVGWVSVDDHDNDPAVLLTYVAVALDRIERISPTVFRALASSGAGMEVPRRLASAMAGMDRPITLVVDNLEALTNRECLDTIAVLAVSLPARSQLAIGSRDVLPLPAARLRAQGGIVEIGVDDLAMTSDEAAMLLREAEVELAEDDVARARPQDRGLARRPVPRALAVNAGGRHARRDRRDLHRR